jgi:plastocyanin
VKRFLFAFLAAALVAGLWTTHAPNAARASDSATPAASPAPIVVHTKDFAYKPLTLTVPAGTAVTFVNDDDAAHTVTSSDDKKVFDSGNMDKNAKFTFTFKNPGTYQYFCLYHAFMKAKVIVTAADAPK